MRILTALWTFITTRLVVRAYVPFIAIISGPLAIYLALTGHCGAIPVLIVVLLISNLTGIRIAPRPTSSKES